MLYYTFIAFIYTRSLNVTYIQTHVHVPTHIQKYRETNTCMQAYKNTHKYKLKNIELDARQEILMFNSLINP